MCSEAQLIFSDIDCCILHFTAKKCREMERMDGGMCSKNKRNNDVDKLKPVYEGAVTVNMLPLTFDNVMQLVNS